MHAPETQPYPDVRRRALDEVRRIVFRRLGAHAARVYLIGSCARGDWTRASDIDIAIEPLEPVPDLLVPAIRGDLEESDIPYVVDVLDMRWLDPAFVAQIRREGLPWTPPNGD